MPTPGMKPGAIGAAPCSRLPRAEHRPRRQFAKQRFPTASKSDATFCCTLIRGPSFVLLPSGGCRYFNFAKRGHFPFENLLKRKRVGFDYKAVLAKSSPSSSVSADSILPSATTII